MIFCVRVCVFVQKHALTDKHTHTHQKYGHNYTFQQLYYRNWNFIIIHELNLRDARTYSVEDFKFIRTTIVHIFSYRAHRCLNNCFRSKQYIVYIYCMVVYGCPRFTRNYELKIDKQTCMDSSLLSKHTTK